MAHDIIKDWTTKAGLRAVVLFVRDSHHCGYVAITKDHPLHGVGYSEKHPALRWSALEGQPMGGRGFIPLFCASVREGDPEHAAPDIYFDVHGSITFADHGDGYPAEGEGLWWYGFDCSHAGDLRKKDIGTEWDSGDSVFRDADYAIEQCENLARQLESVREMAVRCAV